MKKMIITALAVISIGITAFGQEPAPAPEFALGDYIQFGTYEGNPILWRCADKTEEYGALLLSDTVLCKKAFDAQDLLENSPHRFGSNFWEESNLRAWLNSTAPAGEVIWPGNNPLRPK